MNKKEIDDWYYLGFLSAFPVLPITIKGVTFSKFLDSSIVYTYKNAKGFIRPDNGYNGGDSFYPRLKVNPHYSEECRFNPSCAPERFAVADAVIQSWNDFIS